MQRATCHVMLVMVSLASWHQTSSKENLPDQPGLPLQDMKPHLAVNGFENELNFVREYETAPSVRITDATRNITNKEIAFFSGEKFLKPRYNIQDSHVDLQRQLPVQYLKNGTIYHSQIVEESLLNISSVFEKIKLFDRCAPTPGKYRRKLITDAVDHIFLSTDALQEKKIGPLSWKNTKHPMRRLLNVFSDKNNDKVKKCYQKQDQNILGNQFRDIVNTMDPDILEFLSLKITPMYSYVMNGRMDKEKFHEVVQQLCNSTHVFFTADLEECTDIMSNAAHTLGLSELIKNRSSSSSTSRVKRFTQNHLNEDDGTDLERSGYGDAGNYVIIPDDGGYDKSHLYLIKLLALWALGAYALLGLLAYKSYFLGSVLGGAGGAGGSGLPGPKGPDGTGGALGVKGVKGANGDKGMKGLAHPGDKGMKGALGSKGVKGVKGNKGVKGFKGYKGDKGFKGRQGDMGDDGMMGPMGDKGRKGDKGNMGDMGSEGQPGKRRRRRQLPSLIDLLDTPTVLKELYEMKDDSYQNNRVRNFNSNTVVNTLNTLWAEHKNPFGCGRCLLFELLEMEPEDELDSYIIAGFSHVLGDSGSLQLLDDVREGRRRGMKMLCRRRKSTCKIEYLPDISY